MTRRRITVCSSAGHNIVRRTLDNLPGKVLAKEYRLALPEEKRIAEEMERVRKRLEPSRVSVR